MGNFRVDNFAVSIDKVEISNRTNKNKNEFMYSDTAEILVHYYAEETIAKPNIVLRIIRSDGITCCMIRTADHPSLLECMKGKGAISIGVDPLQLAGGSYCINVKIMNEVIDGVPLAEANSNWFYVIGRSLSYEEISGVFVPQVKWIKKIIKK
jgi:hypothetical protein